jgi:hypothetical protein
MFKSLNVEMSFLVAEIKGERVQFATLEYRYEHPSGGRNGYTANFIQQGDKLIPRL